MKDEIKKILEYLKNNTFIPDETKRKYKILHRDEVNKLLDYITNLQEENKDLQERYNLVCKISEERKNKWLSLNEENEDLFSVIKDYKSRNEKALEELKYYQSVSGNHEFKNIQNIIDKLKGVDKE